MVPQTKGEITGHLFGIRLLEKLVDFLRVNLSEKMLSFTLKWSKIIGHFGLITAAILGLLFAIIFAIRVNDFYAFLMGIAWFFVVFVIQYIAYKFSDAGENLIRSNPTSLSSKVFLDCIAFLFAIGGLVILVIRLIGLIKTGDFSIFLRGLGIFVLFEFLAIVSFNFRTITMEIIEETTAGQEAIGIITFFIKAFMKLVPIFFGVGVVIGTVLLFINSIGLFSNEKIEQSWISGNAHAMMILYAGILPFIGYILFVLFYLAVDIIRAILSLPGKLDRIAKK